jgi:hypothetical protein
VTETQHERDGVVVGQAVLSGERMPGRGREGVADRGADTLPFSTTIPPRRGGDIGGLAPVLVIRTHVRLVTDFRESAADHRLGLAVVRVALP